MKTILDAAGQVAIPKELLDEAGIKPGEELDVRCRNGRIEIEPAPEYARLERHGRFLVAVIDKNAPPIDPDIFTKTLEKLRDERGMIDHSVP